jgi:hypothetical protein
MPVRAWMRFLRFAGIDAAQDLAAPTLEAPARAAAEGTPITRRRRGR